MHSSTPPSSNDGSEPDIPSLKTIQCLDAFCPLRFEERTDMLYHCVKMHGEGLIECPNRFCFYKTSDVHL